MAGSSPWDGNPARPIRLDVWGRNFSATLCPSFRFGPVDLAHSLRRPNQTPARRRISGNESAKALDRQEPLQFGMARSADC